MRPGGLPLIVDGVEQIDVAEAERRLHGGALMLDVREHEERDQARIPGTLFIPLSQLQQRWSELPAGTPLIVQCAGGSRSHQAARFLRAQGFDACNLAPGLAGWFRMGRPVDTGPP